MWGTDESGGTNGKASQPCRVGWAYVQLTEGINSIGESEIALAKIVAGALPGKQQTVPRAEITAITQLIENAKITI